MNRDEKQAEYLKLIEGLDTDNPKHEHLFAEAVEKVHGKSNLTQYIETLTEEEKVQYLSRPEFQESASDAAWKIERLGNFLENLANFIIKGFPGAELVREGEGMSLNFLVFFNGKKLLILDSECATIFVPASWKSGKLQWSSILEGGPENIADHLLRQCANAGYVVYSHRGSRIQPKGLKKRTKKKEKPLENEDFEFSIICFPINPALIPDPPHPDFYLNNPLDESVSKHLGGQDG